MNNRLILVILSVVLISFSLLVGGSFLYLLLFILITILLFSYFSIKNIEKNLIGVYWCEVKSVTKGDDIELNYRLYNSSMLPIPYGEIKLDVPSRLSLEDNRKKVYFISPYEDLIINNKVKCNHRGIYEVGLLNVNMGDIFGIFKKKISVKDSVSITVYPKVYDISHFKLDGKEYFGFNRTNQKLNEDYSSLRDIREYRSGDSIKRVDWKTTSKMGELFVKNYDVSVQLQIKLFMDFQFSKYQDDYDELIEEKVVECVISIIHHTLFNKIKVDFITYSDKKVEISSRDISRFGDFLDTLTVVKPKKDINLGDVIINESRGFSQGMTVIIVTPKVDDRLLTSLLTLKNSGYVVIVIFIGNLDKERKVDKNTLLVEKAGVKVYKVDINDNITYVLR